MTELHDGADIRERMDRTLTDLPAPDGLTAAALAGGHRLRRRRRALTAASGLAAAAVVAVVITSFGGGITGAEPQIATQPPAPSEKAPSPSPDGQTPSLAPEGDMPFNEPPAGWWDMPSEEMAAHLEELLPQDVSAIDVDTVMEDVGPGEDPVTSGTLHATLESETGPGGFEILMYPPELDVEPDPETTTDADGTEHTDVYAQGLGYEERTSCPGNLIRPDKCIEITGGGGVHVGRASVTTTGGITVHEVVLHGPDGGLVYFATANSTDSKWGRGSTTSAEAPALPLAQLRELALDPAWTSYQP